MKNPVIGSDDILQPDREHRLGERGRDLRHEDAGAVGETASGSAARVAGGGHDVDIPALRSAS